MKRKRPHDSHVFTYYRHLKFLRDLRFLCKINGAPFIYCCTDRPALFYKTSIL